MGTPLFTIPGTTLPWWASSLAEDGQPCIIDDLVNDDYHNTRAMVSKTAMDKADKSGKKYRYWIDHAEEDEPGTEAAAELEKEKPALVEGDAFHCLVLEPLAFDRRFFVLPDNLGDMRSSKNRKYRDDMIAEQAPGGTKTILKHTQFQMINGMRDSAFSVPKLRAILEDGKPEVTAIWIDPDTGLPCKIRTDWLTERMRMALDLKSARDASKQWWKLEAARRRLFVQDAFYTRGLYENGIEADEFVFAVVEKEPPYDVGLYHLPEGARLAGENAYMRNLRDIRKWVEAGEYPSYTDGVEMIDIPPWAFAQDAMDK